MPDPPDIILHQGKWLTFGKERETEWEYVSRPQVKGAVAILAVTERREILLVEQYRPPVQRRTLELPAGLAGDDAYKRDEPLVAAAKRELYEETGYEAKDWYRLGAGPSSTGTCDEVVTMFLATGLRKVAERETHGVGNESIKLHVKPLAGILDYFEAERDAGLLVDWKVPAALYMAEHHPMFPTG